MFRKNDLIFYIDDTGIERKGYVNIIKLTDSYVSFLLNGNEVIIPMHRVLKIKRGVA